MKNYIILFLLLIPMVVAPTSLENTSNILNNNLEELKAEYNQDLEKVPWIAKTIIGNERVNLYLTLNNGTQTIISGTTKKAKILQIQKEEIKNPTLKIFITENTVKRLMNKETTLEQAVKSKEITYKSQRIRTSIKTWFAKRFLKYF